MTDFIEDKPITLRTDHMEKLAGDNGVKYFSEISTQCPAAGINTLYRYAMFLAQTMHESANYTRVRELGNGKSSDGIDHYFDKYAGRYGNGILGTGDAEKYRGRGLIQITFKSNYIDCARSTGLNCVTNPEVLETTNGAVKSAIWYWKSKGLNAYADRADVVGCTRRINGGLNGLVERQALYERALCILNDGVDCGKPPLSKKTTPITRNPTPYSKYGSIKEPELKVGKSKYPWNMVFESRSGHVIEIDDYPGEERINLYHRSGSYIEIAPDGTLTIKSVLDRYDISQGDKLTSIKGDQTTKVSRRIV